MEQHPAGTRFSAADLERLRGLARGLVPEQDVDDLTQDAWLVARNATHDDQPAWWRTVLRRRRAMNHRANTRRRAREERDAPSQAATPDPDAVLERTRLCEALENALGRLDPRDRELVVRRYCEGSSASELSSALDLPASTVRTRLSRSLKRLRSHLDRTYGERSAWLSAVLVLSPSNPTNLAPRGALAMSTSAKFILAATAGSLALAATAWSQTQAPDPAPVVSLTGSTREGAEPVAAGKRKRSKARKRWERTRKKIAKRRARSAKKPAPTPSVLGDESTEDVLADFREKFAEAKALGPVITQVVEQGVPLFVECLETLPESATGSLHLRANVIGEPEDGGIVETVDIVDDTLDQPDFEECLRESTYAIRIEELESSVSKALDIRLDMETRSLNVSAPLELDELAAIPERDPEVWAEMLHAPEALRSLSELAEQPGVEEQYPALVAAIRSAAE